MRMVSLLLVSVLASSCSFDQNPEPLASEELPVVAGKPSTRPHVGTFVNPFGKADCTGTMISYNVVLTTRHCREYFWNQRQKTYFVTVDNATARPYRCNNNPNCFEVIAMSDSPIVARIYNGEQDMITALKIRRNAPLGRLSRTYTYDRPVADGTSMAMNGLAILDGYGCIAWVAGVPPAFSVRRYGYLRYSHVVTTDISPHLYFGPDSGNIGCYGDSGGPVRLVVAPRKSTDDLVGIEFASNMVDHTLVHAVSHSIEFIRGRINLWTDQMTPVTAAVHVTGRSLPRVGRVLIAGPPGGPSCTYRSVPGAGELTFGATCTGKVAAAVTNVRLRARVFAPTGTEYAQSQLLTSWICVRRMSALERQRRLFTPDTSAALQGPQTRTNGRTTDCVLQVTVR